MRAYRLETTLDGDGNIALRDLPFNAGERVEIIVLSAESAAAVEHSPMPEQPYRYDDPFGPAVDPQDWDAMK